MKNLFKVPVVLSLMLLMSSSVIIAEANSEVLCDEAVTKPFRGINVMGNVNVVLVSDTFHGVRIMKDNEDSESVVPRIANRSLYLVRTRESNELPVTVFVSFKELKAIETYGAAHVSNEGTLVSKNIYLYVHESGEINLNLVADNISANVKQNGKIIIDGDFDESVINVKGKGKVRLKNGGRADRIITGL